MIALMLTSEELTALKYAVAKGLEGFEKALAHADEIGTPERMVKQLQAHQQALVNVEQQMKGLAA